MIYDRCRDVIRIKGRARRKSLRKCLFACRDRRRETAPVSEGIEEWIRGRFAEKAKFRLDGFWPSGVPRVLHQCTRRYGGFKEARTSLGYLCEVLSTLQLGSARR
jgi:hypothetical protein